MEIQDSQAVKQVPQDEEESKTSVGKASPPLSPRLMKEEIEQSVLYPSEPQPQEQPRLIKKKRNKKKKKTGASELGPI